MKKFFALVFASLLAFACIASPPGKPQSGTKNEKFESQAASRDVTVQDQNLINCNIAVVATVQHIEFTSLEPTCLINCYQNTNGAGSVSNFEISPFPAELGANSWRQTLLKFQYSYLTYGYHRRSNSPPPNLS